MTEFTNLLNPQEFTTSLAILVVFLFGVIGNAGIRLKSPFVLFIWTLTLIVFVLSFIANMAFIWFWIMIVVSFISIVVASIAQYML